MSDTRTTSPGAGIDLATGLVLGAANVLFIVRIGYWLNYTGALCLALFVITVLAALAGQRRLRRLTTDCMLALTMLNFNGWAFSHLGNLLGLLGLFFFVLFGLIMGAALLRALKHFMPLPRSAFFISGTVFVLGAWLGAVLLEASYYPNDAYQYALDIQPKRLAPGVTAEQERQALMEQASQTLEDHYGGRGTIAYLRWGLDSGEVELTKPGLVKSITYTLRQRRVWMWIRLTLSVVLLVFGVFSQLKIPGPIEAQPEEVSGSSASEHAADHSHSIVAGGFEDKS